MADAFLAEIRIFSGTYAPTGWALCNGQVLPISQNLALFSLLGTTYGGNGTTNFALPNLQGSAPLQQGQGDGLSQRVLGQVAGTQTVTLSSSQLPTHTHTAGVVAAAGNSTQPGGKAWARANLGRQSDVIYSTAAPTLAMSPQTSQVIGGSQPHNNMPPYLAVTFIIALQGIFPTRP